MDKVVFPRVEMDVRSITGSLGHGTDSVVPNPDWRDFTGNTENTRLMSASSRLDLYMDQVRIDETRDIENFEDGDFPALKPKYDRRAHTHHRNSNRYVMTPCLRCKVFRAFCEIKNLKIDFSTFLVILF